VTCPCWEKENQSLLNGLKGQRNKEAKFLVAHSQSQTLGWQIVKAQHLQRQIINFFSPRKLVVQACIVA
jgi:hypothetical protein